MPIVDAFIKATAAADVYDACQKAVEKYFGHRRKNGAAPLDQLARDKGIVVEYRNQLTFEGMIERSGDGKATIVIRHGLNRRRERFTFAHELGHWMLQEEMLGTTKGQLFRGLSRDAKELREEETLANLLAAELLLPSDEVSASFDSQSPIESLVDICRQFAVSRTMAVRRIADICSLNIVFLQIMPYDLTTPDSIAQIDDAIYASARSGTLFDRDGTRFSGKLRFSEVVANRKVRLELNSPKGKISADFHTQFRPDPALHAFALVTLDSWPVKRDTES